MMYDGRDNLSEGLTASGWPVGIPGCVGGHCLT